MKLDIFGKTIEITGSNPVADYLRSELSDMPKSSDRPMISIEIEAGFDSHPDVGFTSRTKVNRANDTIFINRHKPVPVRGVKDLIHNHVGTLGRRLQITLGKDVTRVKIRYDPRVTDNNRLVRDALRSINRSYIYRSQNLAKVILYNDIEPLIHQILIEDGAAFIHSSCVSRDGAGILISGWGGTGKTSVATKLIDTGNWNFVADDLCLVRSDGTAQPYLKRVQIYPYNISKQYESQLISSDSLMDGINWKIRSTILGQDSVRRRISPLKLFPVSDENDIDISTLIYLSREDRKEISHDKEELKWLCRRAAATIAHEFSTHIRDLRSLTATYPDLWPSAEDIVNRSQDIFENSFDSSLYTLVRVPHSTTPAELSDYIQREVL